MGQEVNKIPTISIGDHTVGGRIHLPRVNYQQPFLRRSDQQTRLKGISCHVKANQEDVGEQHAH